MSISISNNKQQWCVCRQQQSTGGLTAQSQLVWSEGRQLLGAVLHASNEHMNSHNDFCHDNGTINTILVTPPKLVELRDRSLSFCL